MTREEAISLLMQVNKILVNSNSWLENTHEPLNEAFNMAIEALDQEPKTNDMTSSQSETEIYKGCISLMWELMGSFCKWLDYIGVDITKLDEEEQFSARFYPTQIVEKLFLWHTTHSGGTSQRMKCNELGIDTDNTVTFDFSDELE